MKTLGLIPARGGSKGIPGKNIKPLAGRPLIAWTIEAARRSRWLDSVVVSTDDEEIAAVARKWGADVPFMRPAALAQDDSPGLDPVFHALEWGPSFDAVLLLQPTSPLRTTGDIDACLTLAKEKEAPSVVAVTAPGRHPYWMYEVDADGRMRKVIDVPTVLLRQHLPPVYAVNGALYFARAAWLQASRTFLSAEAIAYVMPRERSVDLDSPLDWALAELLLKTPS